MTNRQRVVIVVIGTCTVLGLLAIPAWRSYPLLPQLWGFVSDSPCGFWAAWIAGGSEGVSTVRLDSYPTLLIPRWTDDGQRVVFESPVPRVNRNPNPPLIQDNIRIAVDGHNFERTVLIPTDAPSPEPWRSSDYAPDVAGDKMVFTTPRHSCEERKRYEVASVNLDGSGYKRLTHADGADLHPTWSRTAL